MFSMVVYIPVLETFQRSKFRKPNDILHGLMYITFNITSYDLVLDKNAILLNILYSANNNVKCVPLIVYKKIVYFQVQYFSFNNYI